MTDHRKALKVHLLLTRAKPAAEATEESAASAVDKAVKERIMDRAVQWSEVFEVGKIE